MMSEMRYLDTGSRDPAQALGAWLQNELTSDVTEVRWQSGFFAADGLGYFVPTLRRLAADDRTVRVLIGSNDGATLRDYVLQLMEHLGLPRAHADLGLVSYSGGAYFHPKVYHLRRTDGSQGAYVGSANLTASGIASLHVEAGVVLDTRDDDPAEVLDQIAMTIDEWFETDRDGFSLVTDTDVVEQLVADGILTETPPPRTYTRNGAGGDGAGVPARPRLRPLINLPPLTSESGLTPAVPGARPPERTGNLVVTRPNFPDYMLHDPNADGPTSGSDILSGITLPNEAVGLIVRLNRDDVRGFHGGVGNANISIPYSSRDVVSTLRFGINPEGVKYKDRPRAEFTLHIRYQGQRQTVVLSVDTNVMAYGFLPGESSHKNIRLFVPAPATHSLREKLDSTKLPIPRAGDLALLEWPTRISPEFRLTYLQPNSQLFQQVEDLFTHAFAGRQNVGRGACLLPPDVPPPW